MKLKRNLANSSNSSVAVDDATLVEDLEFRSFPIALQISASFDAPVELPNTPTSLCARFPLEVPSPSKPVLSPTPNPLQTKSTASPQPVAATTKIAQAPPFVPLSTASFNAVIGASAVSSATSALKSLLNEPSPLKPSKPTASPMAFDADDSPVSRLETFRALMVSRPGTYGFVTGTQTDRMHVASRETQTSPPPQIRMASSSHETQTSPSPPYSQVHQTLTVQDLRNELATASLALVRAFGF
jgi:hypothetical protein